MGGRVIGGAMAIMPGRICHGRVIEGVAHRVLGQFAGQRIRADGFSVPKTPRVSHSKEMFCRKLCDVVASLSSRAVGGALNQEVPRLGWRGTA